MFSFNSSTEFINAINAGQNAFIDSQRALSSGSSADLPPASEELGKAIELLQHVPSLSKEADDLSKDLLSILQKQYERVEEVRRTGRTRLDTFDASPLSQRFQDNDNRLKAWVRREGAKYRIRETQN